MKRYDSWFLDFKSMCWCIFVYLGKIIVIILRCWLLQLTTIHITKLQHPSHKKQTTLETIQISYASFLLLFAYRWPLLLHWRVHRWARSYTWIYLVLKKGYWSFITSHYVCAMNSATPASYSLSPFFLQLRSNSKFVSCCPSFNSSSGTCTNIWTQVISYFSNILSNLLKFFVITFIYIYYLISISFKLKFYTSHLLF